MFTLKRFLVLIKEFCHEFFQHLLGILLSRIFLPPVQQKTAHESWMLRLISFSVLIKSSFMTFCFKQEFIILFYFFCLGYSYSYFAFELLEILFMPYKKHTYYVLERLFDRIRLKSENQLLLLSPTFFYIYPLSIPQHHSPLSSVLSLSLFPFYIKRKTDKFKNKY